MELLSGLLMLAGLAFTAVAAVGFVRLPDVFSRLHMTGVLDTLGAPLILLGAAVQLGPTLTAGKLVLGLAFLFATSPLVGHLLSVAALEAGYDPSLGADAPRRAASASRAGAAESDAASQAPDPEERSGP
jgi:multicomponent Na+:H+ antiporter subunit G